MHCLKINVTNYQSFCFFFIVPLFCTTTTSLQLPDQSGTRWEICVTGEKSAWKFFAEYLVLMLIYFRPWEKKRKKKMVVRAQRVESEEKYDTRRYAKAGRSAKHQVCQITKWGTLVAARQQDWHWFEAAAGAVTCGTAELWRHQTKHPWPTPREWAKSLIFAHPRQLAPFHF